MNALTPDRVLADSEWCATSLYINGLYCNILSAGKSKIVQVLPYNIHYKQALTETQHVHFTRNSVMQRPIVPITYEAVDFSRYLYHLADTCHLHRLGDKNSVLM